MKRKKKHITYGSQFIDNKDIDVVSNSLKNRLITTGKLVKTFENDLNNFFQSKYTTVCSSGTAALHLAFLSIGLKKNDIIIMPSINFIASYNIASQLGAKIYLSDVDSSTGQTNSKLIEKCIIDNKLKNIKCIITMYLGGAPNNVEEIYKLKKKYNTIIIDDACHAFGSFIIKGKKKVMVGSNKFSDISIFSFHPLKAITTAEGGCVTTNNKNYYNKILSFRSHGIKRSKYHWDYNVLLNGYNYRLSDLNCALGISQLKKINKFLNKRNSIYNNYKEIFKNEKLISFPVNDSKIFNSFHLVISQIDFKKLKKSKFFFLNYLFKNQIIAQVHYKPIYRFSIYKKEFNNRRFPGAEQYFSKSFSLPIHYNIKKNDIVFIKTKILNFLNKYKKKSG